MIDSKASDDTSDLLRLARAGDAQAFAVLCERNRQRVWRIVVGVIRRPADADDVTQEVFVRAFCALSQYRGDAAWEAWLCRIALNAAHDYCRSAWYRRVRLWERQPDGDNDENSNRVAQPSAEGEAETRAVQQVIRQAVAALGERERVPLWLIYFEGFTLAEVARLEGLAESTVRSRVQAGLRRLKKQLGDVLNEGELGGENDICRHAEPGHSNNTGSRPCKAVPPSLLMATGEIDRQ